MLGLDEVDKIWETASHGWWGQQDKHTKGSEGNGQVVEVVAQTHSMRNANTK